jgi:transcriptional regulator with XRE-family HTH domain
MAKADQMEIARQVRAFGKNLRDARLRAGYTQMQLSLAAPLDRAAISRIECGERAPDLATLLRICTALDLTPRDLLADIGAGPVSPLGADPGFSSGEDPAARFGANLKWARKRAGISQERLALDAQVDRAAISVYENGGREPNLRTVLKLAFKLDLQPAALLEGVPSPELPKRRSHR